MSRTEVQVAGELAEDPRVRAALASWDGFEHHVEVDSTQDTALDLLRGGHQGRLVVTADVQRRGRGRAGRAWVDAGTHGQPSNLAVTACWPMEPQLRLVTAATGLAVCDAVAAYGVHAVLKWPNDVLVDGHKLAGILVERHEIDGAAVALIGCGIDLDWREVDRTPEQRGWISLAECSAAGADRAGVLAELLTRLEVRLDEAHRHPEGTLEAYRASCDTLGRHVEVLMPAGVVVSGRAVDVDDEGRLLVDADHGRVVVVAGDVVHVLPGPYAG